MKQDELIQDELIQDELTQVELERIIRLSREVKRGAVQLITILPSAKGAGLFIKPYFTKPDEHKKAGAQEERRPAA